MGGSFALSFSLNVSSIFVHLRFNWADHSDLGIIEKIFLRADVEHR